MDKRNKDRRSRSEDEYVSGAAEASIHGGGRCALKVPPGVKMFRPEPDKTYTGDIIPYKCTGGNPVQEAKKGKRYYVRSYYVHNQVGPTRAVILCNSRTFGEKCYICEQREKFQSAHPGEWSKEVKDQFKKYKTSDRAAYCWRDWNDKKAGIQLFDISHAMFGQYLTNRLSLAAREGDRRREFFYRPGKAEGYALKLAPSKKQIETSSATEINTIEFVERERDIPEKVLDAALLLDDIVRDSKLSYKEVKDLFTGGATDDEEETEDEDEDEEEDEGDDDDDDQDEDGDEDDGDDDDDGDDEGDDEDADDEDDEDFEDDEEGSVAVKDVVKFRSKDNEKLAGRVLAIKKGRAKVETKAGKVYYPDVSDCTVVADEGKAPPKKKRPKDDDDDLPPPRSAGKKPKKGGKKPAKKSNREDDEDEDEIPF